MNWPNNVSATQSVHALIRSVSKVFVCLFHSVNPSDVCEDCDAQQSITFSRKIKVCVLATDGELLHPAKYMCNHLHMYLACGPAAAAAGTAALLHSDTDCQRALRPEEG